MKILGISLGTKNGNNDTMCRVGLEAAKEMGAEIEFIHLMDWKIDYCSGCVACSRGLVMGKGMICTRKDDFNTLYEKMIEADGVLVVDPIFESGGTGLFHSITDRMGPGHDTGMLLMLDGKLKEQGKEGLNPRLFQQKAISFVGIGGSDWACLVKNRIFDQGSSTIMAASGIVFPSSPSSNTTNTTGLPVRRRHENSRRHSGSSSVSSLSEPASAAAAFLTHWHSMPSWKASI